MSERNSPDATAEKLEYQCITVQRGAMWSLLAFCASVFVWIALVGGSIYWHIFPLELDRRFLLIVIIIATTGIISSYCNLRWAQKRGRPLDRMALSAFWIGLTGAIISTVCYISPRLGHNPDVNWRKSCARQMMAIGDAINSYATSHNGQYPEDLNVLVHGNYLPNEFLICPTIRKKISDMPLAPSTNVGYVYLGGGLAKPVPGRSVITYETEFHSFGNGIHILLGDGTVQFVAGSDAKLLLQELQNGVNPPKHQWIPVWSFPLGLDNPS